MCCARGLPASSLGLYRRRRVKLFDLYYIFIVVIVLLYYFRLETLRNSPPRQSCRRYERIIRAIQSPVVRTRPYDVRTRALQEVHIRRDRASDKCYYITPGEPHYTSAITCAPAATRNSVIVFIAGAVV